MRLLDLFCGAGGAAVGYYWAGFTEIVGIDIKLQPRYPFEFVQEDALEYCARHGAEFDVIHASPPCKAFTKLRAIHKLQYADYIGQTRKLLKSYHIPYVIENVPGAPLINPLILEGAMFNLGVKRKRCFETYPIIWWPPPLGYQIGKCGPRGEYDRGQYGLITIAGNNFEPAIARIKMGIDWMTGKELSQAIPPAYTEWIGKQLLRLM